MPIGQYIGARYVPKFYENELGTPEWRSNVQYEPLTIVTYAGNSYTSKKPVPAEIGSPDSTPEYWASTGDYNAQIGILTNEVNQLKIDRVLKDHNKIVSLQDFGVEGVGDESSKVADAFQYAKDNDIDYIISSTDVSFKDISFDFSVTLDMMGHTIYPIRYDENSYRMNRLLYCNEPGIYFSMKNAIIQGVAPVNPEEPQSGAQLPYDDNALINIRKADRVIIDNCTFKDINALYYSTITQPHAFVLDIKDVPKTIISNSKFIHLAGLECIWIAPQTLTRNDIDADIINNYFENLYSGSSYNFIGNNIFMRGNVYNNSYAGSAVNCFGLNVKVESEVFKKGYSSAYDLSEGTFFRGHNFECDNIVFLNETTDILLTGNAENIKISNIYGKIKRIATVSKGYGSSYPFADTTPASKINVTVENFYSSESDVFLVRGADDAVTDVALVTIRNCKVNNRYGCIGWKNARYFLENCELKTIVDPGFSALPVFVYIRSADAPKSISMKDCIIHNTDVNNVETLFVGSGLTGMDYLVVKDNYTDATVDDNPWSSGQQPSNSLSKDNFGINNI